MNNVVRLDDDDLWLDFHLYGIQSLDKREYKLAFEINKETHFHFKSSQNHIVLTKNGEFQYIVYDFEDKAHFQTYRLFKNQSLPSQQSFQTLSLFEQTEIYDYLMKKYSFYDFILKTSYPLSNDILVLLSQLSNIASIKKIDITDFKNVKHLIS